jgi:hypothetical protein
MPIKMPSTLEWTVGLVAIQTALCLRNFIVTAMVRILGVIIRCGEEDTAGIVSTRDSDYKPDTKIESATAEPDTDDPATGYVRPQFSEFFALPKVVEKSKRPIMNIVCYIYDNLCGDRQPQGGMYAQHDIHGVATASMILYNQLTSFPSLGGWTDGVAPIDIRIAWACCVCTAFKFVTDEEILHMSLQVAFQVLTPEERSIPRQQLSDTIAKYETFISQHCRVMNAVCDNPTSVARHFLFNMESRGMIIHPVADLGARHVFFFYYNIHTELSQFLFSRNEYFAGRALALVVLACIKALGTQIIITRSIASQEDILSAVMMMQAVLRKGADTQNSIGGEYVNEQSLDYMITKPENLAKALDVLRDLQ